MNDVPPPPVPDPLDNYFLMIRQLMERRDSEGGKIERERIRRILREEEAETLKTLTDSRAVAPVLGIIERLKKKIG